MNTTTLSPFILNAIPLPHFKAVISASLCSRKDRLKSHCCTGELVSPYPLDQDSGSNNLQTSATLYLHVFLGQNDYASRPPAFPWRQNSSSDLSGPPSLDVSPFVTCCRPPLSTRLSFLPPCRCCFETAQELVKEECCGAAA